MNSEQKDGGPAFGHGDHVHGGYPGMSIRDWFAGIVAPTCSGSMREQDLEKAFRGRSGIRREEIVAYQAYAQADAMLAERAKVSR